MNINPSLNASIDMAERASELITHDIRAAMQGLLGGLSRIELDAMSDENRSNMERVRASAELLDALLLLAKGESESAFGSVSDLSEICELLRGRWTSQAEEKGIGFELQTEIDLPSRIMVPSTDMLRTLNNIIGNAIKYTDTGKVRVACACDHENGLIFTIQDHGPGFSDEAIDRLFEFRGRPTDAGKHGTGLGLHIAQSLMANYRAEIDVRNIEDGSEVTLRFPPDLCSDDDEVLSDMRDEIPSLRGKRILVAEDNVTSQFVVGEMLQKMGAETVIVSDGIEALAAFEKQPFDLLLLDVEMPRKSGLAVIHEIRARGDERAKTPLVVLTAYVLQEHRDAINVAGADGILSKPVGSIAALGHSLLGYLGEEEAEPDQGTVDIETYEQLMRTMGPAAGGELLKQLSKDLDSIEKNLVQGLSSNDFNSIRAQSHILISVAGAIGGTPAQAAARELNDLAKMKDAGNVLRQGETCMRELSALIEFIKVKQIQVV